MAILSKDEIVKAQDIKFSDVEMPEWGGTVRLKCMNGTERDSYEESLYEFKTTAEGKGSLKLKREDMRAKLLVRVIVDEEGHRIFSDKDVPLLGTKGAHELDRLYAEAMSLNKMSKEEMEKAEKNLE